MKSELLKDGEKAGLQEAGTQWQEGAAEVIWILGSHLPRKLLELRPVVSWFSSVILIPSQLLPALLICVFLFNKVWRDFRQWQKDHPC